MKKGVLKIIAFTLGGCLLLYLLWYAFGDQVVHKVNTSRSQEVEVVGWDSQANRLDVRFDKNGSIRDATVSLGSPPPTVIVRDESSGGGELYAEVDGGDPAQWGTAFCPGDRLTLKSTIRNVSRFYEFEDPKINLIKNLGPRTCIK